MQQHSYEQSQTGHGDDQRRQTSVDAHLPQAPHRMHEMARRGGAYRQRVDERVLARRKEEHGCVVHTGIDNQSDERTVVDEQPASASDQPSVVKDENVSLD